MGGGFVVAKTCQLFEINFLDGNQGRGAYSVRETK
jgi:hypothetical protein